MATKNDLVEAQTFSRRRLLTAFVSGAPGGRELQPAAPLRAVIAGVALTAAVVLAGVFYGLLQPGLPPGWQNNRLVIAKDTGARYITSDSVLHPVLNTVSARLLIPSGDFTVVTTDGATLASLKLGGPVGIVGAPDTLPAPTLLSNDGWAACIPDGGGVATRIGDADGDHVAATTGAVVAQNGSRTWVVSGEERFLVQGDQPDAVLRAAGISSLDPVTADTSWLNLFTQGSELAPIVVSNAGLPLSGTAFRIGDVLHVTGTAESSRLVVETDGTLGTLSPLAWQLYQLGSGRDTGQVQEVSASDISSLRTGSPIGATDWPSDGFTTVQGTDRPCALLKHDAKGAPHTVLATAPDSRVGASGVSVVAGRGALVRAGGSGDQGSALLTLVDATGTAYALPGASTETIKRLGYSTSDVGRVDRDWIALLPSGPSLTTKAAGRRPGGS